MINIKLILTFTLTLTLVVSCSLNSTQETNLNNQLQHYLEARNKCQITGIVGYTHPSYVRDLKNLGDSIFKSSFSCADSNGATQNFFNPIQRTIQKKNATIHVLYEVEQAAFPNKKDQWTQIYAISENDGKNWFFLPKKAYEDKDFCQGLNRLIHP